MLGNSSITSLVDQAKIIIPRLERITPDSSCSHRAIAIRRSLLQLIQDDKICYEHLLAALESSYQILERAAKERLGKKFTSTTKKPEPLQQ